VQFKKEEYEIETVWKSRLKNTAPPLVAESIPRKAQSNIVRQSVVVEKREAL
jgi:hypothetical protein